MRTILLAALNLTVITVGVGLTLVLCIFLGYTFPLLWFPPVIGLVSGLAVTGVGVFKVRKNTRQASIEYEATRWLASRSNRVQLEVRVKGLGEPGSKGSNVVDSPPVIGLKISLRMA
jgi:hypothetical protein